MSKFSRFNYECQEIAENNPFSSAEEIRQLVKEQFKKRPLLINQAYVTVLSHQMAIKFDMENVA